MSRPAKDREKRTAELCFLCDAPWDEDHPERCDAWPPQSTALDEDGMEALYRQGWSIRRIAARRDCRVGKETVRTRLIERGVSMRPHTQKRRRARLHSNGYVRWGHSYVHRIVCTAWHGPPPSREHVVNHTDGDKTNNHPQNLEWVTPRENVRHAVRTGLLPVGEDRYNAELNAEDVCAMRRMRRTGATYVEIAERFGRHPSHVCSVVRGDKWGSVTEEPPVTNPKEDRHE